jgi:hypothetical protein
MALKLHLTWQEWRKLGHSGGSLPTHDALAFVNPATCTPEGAEVKAFETPHARSTARDIVMLSFGTQKDDPP